MRIPRAATVCLGAMLAGGLALVPAGAGADTRTVHDTPYYDHVTRVIDIKKLKVTYDGKGARAKLYFKNLKKQKRMRIFVSFTTRPDDFPDAPVFGNFLEFRLDERLKRKVRNWVIHPKYDDYDAQRCKGVKVKADFDRDVISYKLPNRCIRFDPNRGYVSSYASSRKFRAAHWDEGSPADTTGTWFDTTPGLRTPR